MIRSGNPALSAKTFANVPTAAGSERMTIQGTVNKTAIALLLLMAAATWVWSKTMSFQPTGEPFNVKAFILIGLIGGFVVAIATVFKPTWAPTTTPIYAVLEGLALGAISALFEMRFPGIVMQAVGLTFLTLFSLLAAYKSGLIKATENFKLGVVAATGGIMLIYVATWILGMFGVQIPLIHENGLFGILFSLFVCVIAALNLVLDFDFIESGEEKGAPKYMEWYGAFGLLVTLIWLYLEILHLLSKLQSRR